MEPIRCAYCGGEITRFEEWVEIDGEYYHLEHAPRKKPKTYGERVQPAEGLGEFEPTPWKGGLTY